MYSRAITTLDNNNIILDMASSTTILNICEEFKALIYNVLWIDQKIADIAMLPLQDDRMYALDIHDDRARLAFDERHAPIKAGLLQCRRALFDDCSKASIKYHSELDEWISIHLPFLENHFNHITWFDGQSSKLARAKWWDNFKTKTCALYECPRPLRKHWLKLYEDIQRDLADGLIFNDPYRPPNVIAEVELIFEDDHERLNNMTPSNSTAVSSPSIYNNIPPQPHVYDDYFADWEEEKSNN